MTSDAKIGLLVGLVFIFVIAFIINGLPGSRQKQDSNKLTKEMVGLEDRQPGLGGKERRVQFSFDRARPSEGQYIRPVGPDGGEQQVRFTMQLPQGPASPAAHRGQVTEAKAVVSAEALPLPSAQSAGRLPGELMRQRDVRSVVALPKSYVVQDGDNLSKIAQKLYGTEEGNRLVNVERVFQANRSTLSSPDQLYVGQKLTIPPLISLPRASGQPLQASGGGVSGPSPGPLGGQFEQVESIGRRAISTKLPSRSEQSQTCVVQDGDSLWRIAQAYLGDGSRYREIVALNSERINDEDDLTVGTRLRLPAQ